MVGQDRGRGRLGHRRGGRAAADPTAAQQGSRGALLEEMLGGDQGGLLGLGAENADLIEELLHFLSAACQGPVQGAP